MTGVLDTQLDRRGKIFTEVISKNEIPALIQTVTHLVQGHIYIHPNIRLVDELNRAKEFIPVTQAVVLGPDGKELYRAEFMTLRTSQIVWVFPQEEEQSSMLGLHRSEAKGDDGRP